MDNSLQPKLATKTKVLISILAFVVLFGAMLIAVSVNGGAYDLAVSKVLVDLEDGNYLSDNIFGFFFEACGETVLYLLAAFACAVLFWYSYRMMKMSPWNYVFTVVFAVASVVAFWFYFKCIVGYTLDHVIGIGWSDYPDFYSLTKKTIYTIYCLEAAMALVVDVCLLAATRRIKKDMLVKFAKWAIMFVLIAAISNILIILIKDPVGRMRYRAMYALGDNNFEGFTAWYQANGARKGDESLLFAYGIDNGDMFKSFPSGHTCAAGSIYSLMLLPAILGVKKKSVKVWCWALPVVYVGLVAISRIVVGAHYFSDVLFGGTIAFLSAMLVKEVFVDKFKHIKCFKKGYVEPMELDCNCADETVEFA